jgi:NAD(P)-dependent dehydrogenase (short-subunit alcohol dehydrogenase family)
MGLACATRFAAQGAKVVMADVLDGLGLAEAKRLGATYLHCDVANCKDAKATVTAVVGEFGHLDNLMNNAAISIGCNFLEISKADHDRVMDTDLKGSFAMLQARAMVARVAKARPPGATDNLSWVSNTLVIATILACCMAKGGVF